MFAVGQAAGITLILLGLVLRRLGPRNHPRRLRLAPGGGVAVDRVAGGGPIEHGVEAEVRRGDLLVVAALDGFEQSAQERLDLGAVAQVLESLPGSGADALCLLLGVRHRGGR